MSRISVLTFFILWVVSMNAYPGWNAFEPDRAGHDFFRNFICDLFSATTPDGRSNMVGSTAMNVGAIFFVCGSLLPMWWQVDVRAPWRSVCRILGGVTALLTIAICIEQAFALDVSHNVITLTAAAAGIIPTIFVAATAWRANHWTTLRRTLIIGVLAAALVNFVTYALVQTGGTLTPVVPASQKVALIFLIAWLAIHPSKAKQ